MTTTTFQDYEYHILYSRIYHKYMHRILTQLADRHPEFMHDPELCMDYIEECLGQEIEDRLSTKEWFRRIRGSYLPELVKKLQYRDKYEPETLQEVIEAIIQEFEEDAEGWANPNQREE